MQAFMRVTTPIAASLRRALLPAGALLLAAAAFSPAQAQFAPRPAISVQAGMLEYDLSGVGTGPHFAARGEMPIGSLLLIEGSLGYSRATPREQALGAATSLTASGSSPRAEERVTVLIPELQAQLQYPLGRVAPYLGVGGGALMALPGEAQTERQTRLSLSGAGGVRVQLVERLGARAEVRVRGVRIEDALFGGSTAEVTAGLSWRL